MLLYYLFWILMGFILHFYIIFGTNLLTQGPVQIVVFCIFQCFTEKEYQTESKQNKTFGRVIFRTNLIQGTWSRRLGSLEEATRQGGAPYPPGRAPTLVGPLQLHRPTSSSYIFIYPENIQEHHETLFSPPQPSVPKRSHLGAFSRAPPEGESIMEGLSINSMAPLMMCE